MFEQQIRCPECGTMIHVDIKQLLMGMQFMCPTCASSIGLSNESKPVVENAMEKLENLKKSAIK